MRNSYWLLTGLLVLECVVVLLFIEPAECFLSFIPVSVHTALQILTLLVKIKSIIFKILLGLKLMGVEGFIMRRRRRSLSGDEFNEIPEMGHRHPTDTDSKSYLDWKLGELPEEQRTELLMAWGRLERLLGQSIQFQEKVCVDAVQKYGRKPITIWGRPDANTSNSYAEASAENGGVQSSTSYWISTVLGSALGSPYACHILEKQLKLTRPLVDIPTKLSSFISSDRGTDTESLTLSASNNSVLSNTNSVLLDTGAFS